MYRHNDFVCFLCCALAVTASGCGDPASSGDAGVPGRDGATSAPGDCVAWCEMMETTCPEEAIHPRSGCEALCAAPLAGTIADGLQSDTATNTWGCRMQWVQRAEAAANEAERLQACAAASPSGGDVCGTLCEGYCAAAEVTCTGRDMLFGSAGECATTCAGFGSFDDVLTGISVTPQQFGYGDTVLCRLHHLHAAAIQQLPSLHCSHAAPRPHPVTCSDEAPPNIANYCAFASTFCTDHLEGVADADECMNTLGRVINRYDEGDHATFTDTATNSLGCLNHWILKTPLDPARYCAMANWDPAQWDTAGGQGVCSP